MTIAFTVSAVIPASPGAIYGAWLDSDGHTNVPDDQASHEPGWTTHYFEPMQKYFRAWTDRE